MRKIVHHSFTMGRRAIGYGIFGVCVTLLGVAIYSLQKRPDLELWQTVILDEEFTAKSDVHDFAGYLKLEDRLFQQLEDKIYQKTGPANRGSINRYQHGSTTDPTAMKPNWNRSFELTTANPAAGVLLLHGLSDSPYSLRHFGESLHAGGASVVGLRIPGHGTAPSGLVEVTWQDMAAAVRIAVRHLQESVGNKPIYLVGYSNGGALAVNYALECLDEASLPRVKGIALMSPEIGVTPAAALAVWQGRIGHGLGLEKLAWSSISLEYDPYKYNSFAVNAGNLAYQITSSIDERLGKLAGEHKLGDFPPILAFQSAIDATVSAPDLVRRLFDRLPAKGHELVVFDMNRLANIEHLLVRDPEKDLGKLLAKPSQHFTLSMVTNNPKFTDGSPQVVVRRRVNGGEIATQPLGVSWPRETYSLSHLALPFPAEDPIYGKSGSHGGITLGSLALRGERGAIRITAADMLRQRWNPFYPWMRQRVHAFFELPDPAIPATDGE